MPAPPTSNGIRGPLLPTSRPASGGRSPVITAIGNVSRPACNGLNPRTFCR